MRNKTTYVWNFSGRFFSQILFIVTSIVLARHLSPDDFGEIGVLTVFLSIASTLSESGFGGSLIKEHNIDKTDCSSVFMFNAAVSLCLYFILFFSAPFLSHLYNDSKLITITRVVSLVFVINSLGIVPRTILTRELRFKNIAIISCISVFCASIISICGSILGWGVYALVAYQIANAAISVSLFHIYCKQPIGLTFSKTSLRRLFSFGAYTTLCNIIDTAYTNILASFFGKFMSIATAGYYFQAQKIESASTSAVTLTVNNVSFPILTRIRDNKDEFIKESNTLLKYIITLIFPLFLILIVYAEPIIQLLFGDKWIPSSPFLKILTVAGLFIIIESLIRNNIKSLGEVKKLFFYNLIKRTIFIITLLISGFIDPMSMLYAYLVCCMVGCVVNVWLYSELVQHKMNIICRNILFLMLIPASLILALYICHKSCNNLMIEIAAIVSIYLVYYYTIITRILKIDIISRLRKILHN